MANSKVLLLLLVVLAPLSVLASEDSQPLPNDTAPVDWAMYDRMWVDGIPRATNAEPMLGHLDEQRATEFLDDTALKWSRHNHCATCHTNVPYLMVRPLLHDRNFAAMEEVRTIVKAYAVKQMEQRPNDVNFLIAAISSALAVNDARSGRDLDPEVGKMFDFLWTTQDPDGAWRYSLNKMLPFLERNYYYVSLLVALGVGYAPGHYYEASSAQAGFAKLQAFLRSNIPVNTHERTVLLWASVRTPGLLTPEQQMSFETALRKLQNADGGWTLPALGRWPRHDGPPNDPKGPSDGYATGLATMVLCERGHGTKDPSIRQAISWIETHQRSSGRWFTRSTYSGRFRNYLSNMGTAYALMALKSCEASTK
jgi:squalene-hopene/tetraprenyl-beta-curcumene cyclase